LVTIPNDGALERRRRRRQLERQTSTLVGRPTPSLKRSSTVKADRCGLRKTQEIAHGRGTVDQMRKPLAQDVRHHRPLGRIESRP